MKNYDNNIDMFDAYLSNMMSDDDKRAFEKRLADEPELRQEFKEHKQLVYFIQESGAESEQEFEQAMKNISDEDFQNIVTSKKEVSAPINTSEDVAEVKPKGRVIPLKKAYQWMSIAAMVVLVAGVGMNMMQRSNFNQQIAQTNDQLKQLQQSNNDMKLAYCNELTSGHTPFEDLTAATRGSENDAVNEKYRIAVDNLKENKTDEAISTLEEIYKESESDRKSEIGYELAYAYVKTGDFDNAKRVIKEVKSNNGNLPQTYLDDLDKLEQKISKPYF